MNIAAAHITGYLFGVNRGVSEGLSAMTLILRRIAAKDDLLP